MLVCPILLCLAGYEWIKDTIFKKYINLQHSLISSKSIFFATSPFHSLQVTQRGQSIALGDQGPTTWPSLGGWDGRSLASVPSFSSAFPTPGEGQKLLGGRLPHPMQGSSNRLFMSSHSEMYLAASSLLWEDEEPDVEALRRRFKSCYQPCPGLSWGNMSHKELLHEQLMIRKCICHAGCWSELAQSWL